MRYLPTGEWMQRADSYTIREIGIPSMVLMERAALKTVEAMELHYHDLSRTIVFCGSGNNGGDGFAIARLLKEKGYHCAVYFAGREASMTDDCQKQKQIAEKCGVPMVTTVYNREYTTIVDAIFGVGLNREITGNYLDVIELMNRLDGRKIAVDIPSGISASTGRVYGKAFRADLTVTFACTKLGLILHPGHLYCGKTVVADIGISTKPFDEENEVCYTYEKSDLVSLLPPRKPNSHKGTYGRILMITGSKGMSGAAYLSAKSAYTSGAGLVQIYTPEENRMILQQLLPEAIVSTYTCFEEEKLKGLLAWANVVCIGCGMGQSKLSERILTETLSEVRVPCVVDADGLNLLSCHLELMHKRESPVVLTPHMKEMSGLLGCSVEELLEERFEKIKEFTNTYGVVCVLKDARTIVVKRDSRIFVNTAGNSSMAKAGSGDVLAGVISGLLAQHKAPYEAAALGVYLHACGGDEAKLEKGSYSVLAEDLIAGIGSGLKKTEENIK